MSRDGIDIKEIWAVCALCGQGVHTEKTDVAHADDWERFDWLRNQPCMEGWLADFGGDGMSRWWCPGCKQHHLDALAKAGVAPEPVTRGEEAPAVVPVKPTLKPYSPKNRCGKCGSRTGIETAWVGAGDSSACPVEHLARRCGRCGYVWQEAPVDTARPVVEEKPTLPFGQESGE